MGLGGRRHDLGERPAVLQDLVLRQTEQQQPRFAQLPVRQLVVLLLRLEVDQDAPDQPDREHDPGQQRDQARAQRPGTSGFSAHQARLR